MLKKYNIYSYLKAGFFFTFFIQVIMLAFFNLTQMKYHIGYDASSYYLKAMEMAKQRTPFIKEWVDQTTLYFDSAVPVAALFYLITDNIFLSYGIANFMIDLGIFYVFYLVLKAMSVSDLSKFVCLNMAACIYISPNFNNANDMSYFSSVLSSGGWYGLKVLIMLLVIKMIFDMEEGKINYFYIVFTEVLLFISGVSSGWYLAVTILAPMILYYIIQMFIHNSIRELINKRVMLLLVSTFLVMSGKAVAVYGLNFESKDSSMVLTGLSVFWKNLGSIVLGFMQLVQAFPYNPDQQALEINGVVYLMGLLIIFACIIAFSYSVMQVFKEIKAWNKIGVLICIFTFNILMFSVLYTTYGSGIFEIRYLIPLFLILIITVGYFIDSLEDHLLFKSWVVSLALVVLIFLNIRYDYLYINTKNNYDTLVTVAEKIESLDVPVVYVCGSELDIDRRNLRVVDKSRIYKFVSETSFNSTSYWGDYTYYSDVASVRGKNALITTEEYLDMIPEYIKNKYVLQEQIDKYLIFGAESNRFDLESGISGEHSIDYLTSNGMSVSGGVIEESSGSFISDETAEGYVVWGPYAKIEAGNYKFIIHYEILQSTDKTAEFVISLDSGNTILSSIPLNKNVNIAAASIEIPQDSEGLEYRVYNHAGTIIQVDFFEIIRFDTK